jgi:hypothetical protein
MTGPIIQSFDVPANDDVDLDFTLTPSTGPDLGPGTKIYFNVYESVFGQPVAGAPSIISKTMESGIEITDPALKTFKVRLVKTDTVGLLRNYYYEVTVIDPENNSVTSTVGVMTVLGTENRPT